MAEKIRLDKYLACKGRGSRAEVKKWIRQGRVWVDGQPAKGAEQKVDPEQSDVAVDGKKVGYTEHEYWMLNKPAGVVSATEDRNCKTVLELLPADARKNLFPVGRLDKDTEGLLLLTDDGELAHRLLSPKKHVDKVYYAIVNGAVFQSDGEAFLGGIDIGEKKPAMPAKLQILSVKDKMSAVLVKIQEGKFHQVKRMFSALGKEVVFLKRLSMGPLALDENLKPGEARRLTKEEQEALEEIGKNQDLDGTEALPKNRSENGKGGEI